MSPGLTPHLVSSSSGTTALMSSSGLPIPSSAIVCGWRWLAALVVGRGWERLWVVGGGWWGAGGGAGGGRQRLK
eukprot:SAG31_NODE_1228_length_9228_cov_5.337386_1_plen_73_part_10